MYTCTLALYFYFRLCLPFLSQFRPVGLHFDFEAERFVVYSLRQARPSPSLGSYHSPTDLSKKGSMFLF